MGLEVFGLLVAVFGLPGLITLSRLFDDVACVPRRPVPVETRDDGHGPYLIDPRDLGRTACRGRCGCVVYTPGVCGACRLGWALTADR